MHIPSQYRYIGEEVLFPLYTEPKIRMSNVDYIETWKSMEQLVGLGLTKNVGVSNCNIEQLTRIISTAKMYVPAINHVECCPGLHQKELFQFCKNSNITVTAYCPLGRPDFRVFAENYNMDKKIQDMCLKYNKTSSQLILRYLVKAKVKSLDFLSFLYKNIYFLFTVSIRRYSDTKISYKKTY